MDVAKFYNGNNDWLTKSGNCVDAAHPQFFTLMQALPALKPHQQNSLIQLHCMSNNICYATSLSFPLHHSKIILICI